MKKLKQNQKTESKAMMLAIKYEKKMGRNPINAAKEGVGYDIKSGNRMIEVKGFCNERYPVISLYKGLKNQLGKKISKYYIYVIYDIEKLPKLKILKPKDLKGKIEKDFRYIVRGKVYRPIKEINLKKL